LYKHTVDGNGVSRGHEQILCRDIIANRITLDANWQHKMILPEYRAVIGTSADPFDQLIAGIERYNLIATLEHLHGNLSGRCQYTCA
jgi:hypothetical protein